VYPLSVTDFQHRSTLFAELPVGTGNRFNYVVPPATLVAALVSMVATEVYGRWSPRTTRLAGITLLACGMYRYSLYRVDVWHLYMGAVPSYLVLVALMADAWSHRIHVAVGNLRWRVPAMAMLLTWVAWHGIQGIEMHDTGELHDGGLLMRVRRIASGEEKPSAGDPYSYDLPRAGDAHVPDDVLHLAHYIREHTGPNEPVWIMTSFLAGGEIYFLSQRRNPTRYEFWSEVTTHYECGLVLQQLQADPPVLIVGNGWGQFTPQIIDWVNAHYKVVDTVDGTEVRRRIDAPVAAR
jgi:hypothetical protein